MFTRPFDFYSRILAGFVILFSLGYHPPALPAPAGQSIALAVDTLIDQNDPAHQACTQAPDDCSLRGAISKANAETDRYYQLILPANLYPLSIPGAREDANATGDLDIRASLLLTGAGAHQTSIDAQAIDRVFQVHPGGSLTIQAVTITGGKTMDGAAGIPGGGSEDGGGFYNAGRLVLTDSIISNNHTGSGGPGGGSEGNGGNSGKGGGIYNTGELIIEHTDLLGNSTGAGGSGASSQPPYPGCGLGGQSGDGGGIYNLGNLRLKDSRLADNMVRAGGDGGVSGWKYEPCQSGQGGSGGGIFTTGHTHIQESSLDHNTAGDSGGGSDPGAGGRGGGIYSTNWLDISDSQVNDNRSGSGSAAGHGGGIYSTGWLQISHSQVNGNQAGAGFIASASGGFGGGIYTRGQAIISDSLVYSNHSGPGGTGAGDWGGFSWVGGDGGHGGGIANTGRLVLKNTTVKDNATGQGGDGGSADETGWGGDGGSGSGLYNAGTAQLWNSPVIGNVSGSGGSIEDIDICWEGLGGLGGSGGGIYNSGDLNLAYSPVLTNTAGQGGPGGDISTCPPGQGGLGGGIYNAGWLASRFSPVTGNTAGQAGPGEAGIYAKGGDGGGIYNQGSLDMLGSVLYHNRAGSGGGLSPHSGDGGGIFIASPGRLDLANAIVAENLVEPGGKGSGLYLAGSSNHLIHTTIAKNTGGDGSGIHLITTNLSMTNTILVGHTVGISLTAGTTAALESTLWGSGLWDNQHDWIGSGTIITGTHNYWDDPVFVSPGAGDYHLAVSSPAIDTGVNTFVNTDVDNQPRPNPDSALPDLGADETWNPIPLAGVQISGPITGTVSVPITLTASIIPANATPNFLYLWTPEPVNGQQTQAARFVLTTPGLQAITVTALNASSVVTDTFVISVEAVIQHIYMPFITSSP